MLIEMLAATTVIALLLACWVWLGVRSEGCGDEQGSGCAAGRFGCLTCSRAPGERSH